MQCTLHMRFPLYSQQLYPGGRLVLDGRMSAGALVSFMLYQQSLNAAFQASPTLFLARLASIHRCSLMILLCPRLQNLGDVFSSLSAAVGAADKVVEMIKRVPRIPAPGPLAPSEFSGRVELQNVGACSTLLASLCWCKPHRLCDCTLISRRLRIPGAAVAARAERRVAAN